MNRVLVNGYWDHAQKKEIRSYAIYGGLIPPFTMSIGDDKYIMPGWYKLSKDEELPNIDDISFHPYNPNKDNNSSIESYKVTGSRGDKYIVINRNGQFSCDCPGGKFRGACKHSTQVQKDLGLVE